MLLLKRLNRKFTGVFFLAVAIGLMTGCGHTPSPVSSAPDAGVQNALASADGYIVFSQRAAVRAAKRVLGETPPGQVKQQTSEDISLKHGGNLEVEIDDYSQGDEHGSDNAHGADNNAGIVQVGKAKFSVKKNSIDTSNLTPDQIQACVRHDKCTISMEVTSGTTLDDICVAFGPSDLAFDPVANLNLQLKGNLNGVLKSGKSQAYHISNSGKVTRVEMVVRIKGGETSIDIDVPGFSRYSFDD